jgi:hypothetical protein
MFILLQRVAVSLSLFTGINTQREAYGLSFFVKPTRNESPVSLSSVLHKPVTYIAGAYASAALSPLRQGSNYLGHLRLLIHQRPLICQEQLFNSSQKVLIKSTLCGIIYRPVMLKKYDHSGASCPRADTPPSLSFSVFTARGKTNNALFALLL